MTHEEYMQKAIGAAQASERRDGCAIVGSGMSLVGVIDDVTQHAEISAIKDACLKMKTINLEGCTLYGTLESCGMCLSAAIWANMDAVYFGAYAADVPKNKYEYKNYSSEKLAAMSRRWNGEPVEVSGGILRTECAALLELYVDWQKVVL